MKDNIHLYWFKKKGKYGNFGDELGPYIINKLSNKKIKQILINRTLIKLILAYIKGIIQGYYSIRNIGNILNTLFLNGNYIISVGSIIGWGSGKRIVWGSGILFEKEKIDNGIFKAVRGKYTKNRLDELGYECPEIFGDPAILLPLIYKPLITKIKKIGLVPHHTQYEHFLNYEKSHNIKVINLLDDVEKVIDNILSCEYIISTSLHGLIVAHSYKIPALWYEYPKIKWHGENIKFLDYFSSVDIDEYEPFNLMDIENINFEIEIKNFNKYQNLASVNCNLDLIQKKLLNAAPFEISKKFLT